MKHILVFSETYYFLDCTEYLVDEDDGDGMITLNIKRKGDLSIVQSASKYRTLNSSISHCDQLFLSLFKLYNDIIEVQKLLFSKVLSFENQYI